MFCFAYDGTIHGDWVSHYAIRLALHQGAPEITLIHIEDGTIPRAILEERIHLLEDRCRMVDIGLKVELRPRLGSVAARLAEGIPPGLGSYVVCGTRIQQRGRGFITGTVSEQLLQMGRFQVLAVRVVNPGLLGHPRSLLMPVTESGMELGDRLPYLKLLAPDLEAIHLLHVAEVGRLGFRRLGQDKWQRLLKRGWETAHALEEGLKEGLDLSRVRVDAKVVVSDDVPKEIVIAANHLNTHLIFLGASQRNLTERFVYGNPIEQVLRSAPCDVAIYRGVA